MSWEDQGRQEHGWFGHGTAPPKLKPDEESDGNGKGGRFGPNGLDQRLHAIGHTVIAALPRTLRHHLAASYEGPALDQLVATMRGWVRGLLLDRAKFASRYFGRAASDPVANHLWQAAKFAAVARNEAELRTGTEHLTAAMQAEGLDRWRQFMNDAQQRATAAARLPVPALNGDPKPATSKVTRSPARAAVSSDGGNGGGSPGPVASAFRHLFGHVAPNQWAANGAAAGGVAGAIVGGAAGGTGEGIADAGAGTLVLPGGGTIAGGAAGVVDGAIKGAAVGGTLGAGVGGMVGKGLGEFINRMEGNEETGSDQDAQKPDPNASKPYRDNPGQLGGRPAAEVEKELDKTLVEQGRWTKSLAKDGNGIRYIDGKGGSVIINKGYPQGLQGSGGDVLHQGPYIKIQPGDIRVPLVGNPALRY